MEISDKNRKAEGNRRRKEREEGREEMGKQ